ncbi:hypothetical protein P9112_009152 [Eukaryota sp. TZLM1-RC]
MSNEDPSSPLMLSDDDIGELPPPRSSFNETHRNISQSVRSSHSDSLGFDAETQALMTNLERELSRATDILNMPHLKNTSKEQVKPRDSHSDPSQVEQLEHQLSQSQSKISLLEEKCSILSGQLDDVSSERDELKKSLTFQEKSFAEKVSQLQGQLSKLMEAAKKVDYDYGQQLSAEQEKYQQLNEKYQICVKELAKYQNSSQSASLDQNSSSILTLLKSIKSEVENSTRQTSSIKTFIDHRFNDLISQLYSTVNSTVVDEPLNEITFDSDLGDVMPSATMTQRHARHPTPRDDRTKKKKKVSNVLKPSERKVVARARKVLSKAK